VGTVSRWVARPGGGFLDVEDVTHDIFLKVHRELPRFRGEARLSTWLYADDGQHRSQPPARRAVSTPVSWHPRPRAGTWPTSGRWPGRDSSDADAQRRLARVLDQLSDRERQVLVLFELEGRSAARSRS